MNRHNSKSGLFLMEMIIVILFFSICSAICINVFAKARITADHSSDLNRAVVRAISAAEVYKSAEGDLKTTGELLDDASGDDLEAVSVSGAALLAEYGDMQLSLTEQGGGRAEISVTSDAPSYAAGADEDGRTEIYHMSVRAEVR
ncbi:MAG: type II secretion system protein [Anaerovoracaceae bacterium]